MTTKARQLAEFIANADVDSDEIATGAVSASKLAATLDLSSKTIVLPDLNQGVTITSPSDAEGLKLNGRSADDIGQLKFYENDGTTSLARLDARTTHFEVGSYNELRISAGGVGNNHLIVDASGRVKIGTTSNTPASADEPGFVFGDNTAGTPTAGVASFVANGAAPLLLTRRVSDGNVLGIADDTTTRGLLRVDGGDLNVSSNANLRLSAGGSSAKMTILSGGRVGIKNTGTDISGTSLDDVVIGAGTTVAGIVLDGGASSDTAYGFANAGTKVGRIQYINSSNSMVFQTNNANQMAIDDSGNVGIGTTGPTFGASGFGLEVKGTGRPTVRVTEETNTHAVQLSAIDGAAILESRSSGMDLVFGTSGVEKMRIDDTNGYAQINSASQIRLSLGNVGTPGTNTANWIRGTGNSLGLNAASDNIHFEIGGSEKFKITASGGALFNSGQDINQNFHVKSSGNANSFFIDGNGGYVGIGTNSPQTPLHIETNQSGISTEIRLKNLQNNRETRLSFYDENNINQLQLQYDNGGNRGYLNTNGNGITVYSNQTSSEIARFGLPGGGISYESSSFRGNVYITNNGWDGAFDNITSGVTGHFLVSDGRHFSQINYNSGGAEIILVNNVNSSGATVALLQYRTLNSNEGTIFGDQNGLSIVNASDYRRKENITDLTGSLSKITKLRPVEYNLRPKYGDATRTTAGFIAHEVESCMPNLVVGTKDAVDSDGNPIMQAVSYNNNEMIATLVGAIKEQQTIIDDLKARIEALEG